MTVAPSRLAEPRYGAAWAALIYTLLTLVLGYPALAGKFLVSADSDQYLGGYPVREFAATLLRTTGHYPLWDPYLRGGMPFVASMNGDMFYPTFLLRLVLPIDVAMTWGFIIHIILAGLFTYCFLRAWKFGFYPALLGGLAYMMGGPISSYVSPGHDGKLFVSALLPLALWMLVRGIRDGRRWSWGAFALTAGLAVLSPHPQLLQYFLLVTGAFALWLTISEVRGGRLDRRTGITRLVVAAAGVALGFVMGAVQYLSVFEYVAWSPRAGGLRSWEAAVSYSLPPEEIFNMYLPQFTGILDAYWGRNGIHFHSEYLGAAVLVLAGLGLGMVRGISRRSFTWFWIGALIVSLLWALGGFTPFYHIVYAVVPGTKFFRAPSTMLFVVGFSVAMLAALGMERALAREFSSRYLIGWLIAGGAVLVLGVTGALSSVAHALAGDERFELVAANQTALALGSVRSFVCVALACGVLILLLRDRVSARAAATAMLVMCAVDLWSVERLYWRFSPPASVLYATDPTIEYLTKQSEPARVLTLPLSNEMAHRDPNFSGDALMVHRVRQVMGYHGNGLGRYEELLGAPEYREVVNPQVWQLLNTQFLLTNVDSLPLPNATKVAGPAQDAAGTKATLFKLPVNAPFAWVAPVIVRAPDDAVLATVRDSRFEVDRAALFDTAAKVQGKQGLKELPPTTGITVHTALYEPGHIRLQLDRPATEGSALVVSENYYPGWVATVDGKPATVGRADFVLIGVPLQAGARTVDLTFTSAAYERGKWITLVALALALAAVVWGLAADQRSPERV